MHIDTTLVGLARDALADGNVFGALEHLDAFLARHPALQPDDIVRLAEDIERTSYHKRIAELVQQIADVWREGEFDGSRARFERYIEDAASISDPREARACLFHSTNAEAS
jgi:hypothetical protein